MLRPVALVWLALLLPCALHAQPRFEDVTSTHLPFSAIQNSMDVEAVDFDGDGDLDLFVAGEFQRNKLLLNDGTGRFTEASNQIPPANPVHDTEDIAAADFDGDGDVDVIFVSEDDVGLGRSNVHEYYQQQENGTLLRIASQLPDSEANALVAADLTGDGALDLIIGNAGQDVILINDGAGSFTDETAARMPVENHTNQDVELADMDGDGDLDLIAGNEEINGFYLNDGTGHFTDASNRLLKGVTMETRKVTPADVDGDGDLDLFLSNVQFLGASQNPQNRLYINDGTGNFSDETASRLPPDQQQTLDGKFGDLDLDGDLDLVVVNIGASHVLLNDGTGVFTNATTAVLGRTVSGAGLGVEIVDFNADGRLDLYFAMRANTPGYPNGDDLLFLNVTETETGVNRPVLPAHPGVKLQPNLPNPFHHATTLRYALAHPAHVVLSVYNSLGQRVDTVQTGWQPAGDHAVTWRAENLPAGVYYSHLQTDAAQMTRALVVW